MNIALILSFPKTSLIDRIASSFPEFQTAHINHIAPHVITDFSKTLCTYLKRGVTEFSPDSWAKKGIKPQEILASEEIDLKKADQIAKIIDARRDKKWIDFYKHLSQFCPLVKAAYEKFLSDHEQFILRDLSQHLFESFTDLLSELFPNVLLSALETYHGPIPLELLMILPKDNIDPELCNSFKTKVFKQAHINQDIGFFTQALSSAFTQRFLDSNFEKICSSLLSEVNEHNSSLSQIFTLLVLDPRFKNSNRLSSNEVFRFLEYAVEAQDFTLLKALKKSDRLTSYLVSCLIKTSPIYFSTIAKINLEHLVDSSILTIATVVSTASFVPLAFPTSAVIHRGFLENEDLYYASTAFFGLELAVRGQGFSLVEGAINSYFLWKEAMSRTIASLPLLL